MDIRVEDAGGKVVQNLFRIGRHLLRSDHHRLLRTRAFAEWEAVT
ncbi:MAG TPA: hypothetical protein QF572_16770 [Vicinamibacterales bacterium]|nr:hypothetical protein [Vicinamibacterales bacterium]